MASPAAHQRDARAAKIAEYERFIGERLQPDLAAAEAAKAKTQLETDRWEALVSNARGVRERGQEELRTMVDLGSQVYCQAEVADTSRLFVAVGLGFHAEMTLVRDAPDAARPRSSSRDDVARSRSVTLLPSLTLLPFAAPTSLPLPGRGRVVRGEENRVARGRDETPRGGGGERPVAHQARRGGHPRAHDAQPRARRAPSRRRRVRKRGRVLKRTRRASRACRFFSPGAKRRYRPRARWSSRLGRPATPSARRANADDSGREAPGDGGGGEMRSGGEGTSAYPKETPRRIRA